MFLTASWRKRHVLCVSECAQTLSACQHQAESTNMHLGYNNKQCGETSLRNSSYWIHTFLRCDSTRETRTHTNIHTLTVIAVYSLLNPVLGSENSQISSLSHQSEDLSHKCPPPCPAERLSVFQPADSKKKEKKARVSS